jgi:tRNA(Ile)-lysidine synthase
MNLLNQFQEYIDEELLFLSSDRLLLAVSGGADSMVLMHLLQRLGYYFEVAHVNYQLRGEESEADEIFVMNYCKEHAITFHTKRFETNLLAKATRKGIQEIARDIRYHWFEEIRTQQNLTYILTAHHANDQAETILHRFIRGSGVKGLSGISSKNHHIVRPLLFAKKSDILHYAAHDMVLYRTDSSNEKKDYTRNFIRHQLIPSIHPLQPALTDTLVQTGKIMEMTRHYFDIYLNTVKKDLCFPVQNGFNVSLSKLSIMPYSAYILFEILSPMDFNLTQCEEIVKAYQQKNTGAQFETKSTIALINRDALEIRHPEEIPETIQILQLPFEAKLPWANYSFEISDFTGFSDDVWWLDFNKFELPIEVHFSFEGKYFQALGMQHKQKISDFFINNKLSRFDKAKALIVQKNEDVLAVLPYRISELYKLNKMEGGFLKISKKNDSYLSENS